VRLGSLCSYARENLPSGQDVGTETLLSLERGGARVGPAENLVLCIPAVATPAGAGDRYQARNLAHAPLPVFPERLAQGALEDLAGTGQRQGSLADFHAARAFVAGYQSLAELDQFVG
jgi:hypothetical protein